MVCNVKCTEGVHCFLSEIMYRLYVTWMWLLRTTYAILNWSQHIRPDPDERTHTDEERRNEWKEEEKNWTINYDLSLQDVRNNPLQENRNSIYWKYFFKCTKFRFLLFTLLLINKCKYVYASNILDRLRTLEKNLTEVCYNLVHN